MVWQFKLAIDSLGSIWNNFATHTDLDRLDSPEIGIEFSNDVVKFCPLDCSHNPSDSRHARLAVHAGRMETLVWNESFGIERSIIACVSLGGVEFGVSVLPCHMLGTDHFERKNECPKLSNKRDG